VKSVSYSFLKTIVPLLLVFIIGFIGSFFYQTNSIDVVKDCLYFSKPVIGILLGYFVFKVINDQFLFFKIFIFLALLCSTVHLFGIIFLSNFNKSSISDLRDGFGFDNFLEIFGFFFLISVPKTVTKPVFKIDLFRKIALIVLSASIFLYFSRTMILMMLVLTISFLGYTKLNKQTLRFLGVLIIFLGFGIVVINSIKVDRNSKGVEALLFKIKMAPAEVFNSKIDRDDHKQLWDHWRAYEAKRAFYLMSEYKLAVVTGTGFGSLVNLKFMAPLSEKKMKYISRLHNGYVFIFYKTGIFGLLLYLSFLFSLYLKIYVNSKNQNAILFSKIISSIGVFYFISTLIITGLYISKDILVFILGGALFFYNTEIDATLIEDSDSVLKTKSII
jgi:hypothetical protein